MRVLRRLWRDFPLLIGAIYAMSIAYGEIANLEPPQRDLVPTALFPLAMPVAVYALRWRTADRTDHRLGVAVVASIQGGPIIEIPAYRLAQPLRGSSANSGGGRHGSACPG